MTTFLLRQLPRTTSHLSPVLRTQRRTMSDAFLHLIPAEGSSTTITSSLPPSIELLHAASRPLNKAGETRIFYSEGKVHATVVVGKGEGDEPVRVAVGTGVKSLRDAGARGVVEIAALGKGHAAGTASTLAIFRYLDLKTAHGSPALASALKDNENGPSITLRPSAETVASSKGELDWETGKIYADAQNWARESMELPANLCTPEIFCERAAALFKDVPNVEVIIRDEAWAREKKMNSFLSVTAGTHTPANFLEIHYSHPECQDDRPIGLVGKGITFDSGGISLKAGADMKLMRGDMGGAAGMVGATYAIAKLGVRTRLVTCTPLAENMPGPSATKPGDVIFAMNGKSIEVDNTDAEGRLVLADALYYLSSEFRPRILLDSATLTGASAISLGSTFSAAYCSDTSLWEDLEAAGKREHDLLWRMPLDDTYTQTMRGTNADLCNIGAKYGGACIAAAFLKEFVHGLTGEEKDRTDIKWGHLDIAGTMDASSESAYQMKGMTGRSVRTVAEFVRASALTKRD